MFIFVYIHIVIARMYFRHTIISMKHFIFQWEPHGNLNYHASSIAGDQISADLAVGTLGRSLPPAASR
jgi:hypothetical protein